MKAFCFTVDDNIRFLKEITQDQPKSLFDHPYTAMLRRLHEAYGIKIQLNLFYAMAGFSLAEMTDRYADEFCACADWLKLSFHSERENDRPYATAGYDEVFGACCAVHREILRFASPASLASTTTVHCCYSTDAGVRALADLGMRGLLGLFGTDEKPRVSYSVREELAREIRRGATVIDRGVAFADLDMVVNNFSIDGVLPKIASLADRSLLHVMIHEQYFYEDYPRYQPDFEEKLCITFAELARLGFENRFFEEMLPE